MPKKRKVKIKKKGLILKINNYFAKHTIVKNILSALAVAIFGFILLNLTFIFDFLFQSLIDWIIRLFTQVDFNMNWYWFPPVKHILFMVVIGLISWPIFKSKLRTLFKAIYMTVPLAVVLATIGITLYPWPVVPYLIGGLLSIGVLCYFYKTKKPWLYYYTVILISIVLLIVGLAGVDI